MAYTAIHSIADGPVVQITLNRPEVHNAFDESLIAELASEYRRCSEDDSIRAVVLKGAGASFCAGADLNWMARMVDYSRAQNLTDARSLREMLAAIYECPKVTIARVHGAAIGGGAGLLAACDIAIASEQAKFAFSEVRLGIAPAVIAPYVIEKIGMGAARGLFVTGDRFDADSALRIGLIQRVVTPDELDSAVESVLQTVLKSGPKAIAATKQLLRSIARKTPPDAADETVECIADLRVSDEGQEGIRAFLEKRGPEFSK